MDAAQGTYLLFGLFLDNHLHLQGLTRFQEGAAMLLVSEEIRHEAEQRGGGQQHQTGTHLQQGGRRRMVKLRQYRQLQNSRVRPE